MNKTGLYRMRMKRYNPVLMSVKFRVRALA